MRITIITKSPEGAITHLVNLNGEVSVDSSKQYMHTRQHPFIPTKIYRYIPYWTDKITVTAVLSSFTSELLRDIFFNLPEDYVLILQWKTGNRIYTRKVRVEELPEPLSVTDTVSLSFEINYTEKSLSYDISKLTLVNSHNHYNQIVTTEPT